MRYHAQALAAHGVHVDLVGFEGTPLARAITENPHITVHRLSASMLRHGAPSLSYAPVALVDAARISFRLWTTLRRLPRPDLVLVQNPPAFPTLVVAHSMMLAETECAAHPVRPAAPLSDRSGTRDVRARCARKS
jgi:beta-1,4-mannosyltransferase